MAPNRARTIHQQKTVIEPIFSLGMHASIQYAVKVSGYSGTNVLGIDLGIKKC